MSTPPSLETEESSRAEQLSKSRETEKEEGTEATAHHGELFVGAAQLGGGAVAGDAEHGVEAAAAAALLSMAGHNQSRAAS